MKPTSAVRSAAGRTEPPCAREALALALPLLRFHTGNDDRASVDGATRALAPVRNPANPRQSLTVVEAWGSVYRARYRLRFLFHRSTDGACVLLGQEVLEHSSP